MTSQKNTPKAQNVPKANPSQTNIIGTQVIKSGKSYADLGGDDDSIIDLEYERNLTKLDYAKMKQSINERHASKLDGQNYDCGDVCCGFEPGSHYCTASSEKSDLTKFGAGMVLYFKFIKHLMFFFFLFILLSIPALVFYTASFYSYNKGAEGLTYLDILTSTTVGALGLGAESCALAKFPYSTTLTQEKEVYFECSTGKIADVDNIVYGLVETGTTCNFFDNKDVNTECNNYNETELYVAFSPCVGETSCTVEIPDEVFVSSTNTKCNNLYSTHNVYVQVSCTTTTLTILGDYEVEKSTIALIVGILDAVIIILFLLMVYTLKFAQKSATQNVLKKAYSASLYTVELKNLPQDMPAEEISAKLWMFLDRRLGDKAIQAGHRVIDVQIVLPNKLIGYSKRAGEMIHKKNSLIRQFVQSFAPDYPSANIDSKGLITIMQNIKQTCPPYLKEAEKLFKKIKDVTEKKEKLFKEIGKLKTTKDIRIVSAFVTFSSIPARNKILDIFVSSPLGRFTRIFCSCCYDKDISFYGHILRAKSSDDPGSILWENLGEPGMSVFLRRTLSTLLTICLWIITGGILIFSTYYKDIFKVSYPTLDCRDKDPTITEAASDFLLGDYQTGLLGCYCQADVLDRLNTIFPTANNDKLCYDWFQNKILQTGITFGMVFIVLLINYGVQFVFQALSKFEKHSTLNRQLAQRVIKTFVAQFLNTGLLIFIINIKIDSISFWQGKFRDIIPLWYENVGSTLLSTMFVNVFTVPTVKVGFVLFQKLVRCCDRGCRSDESFTSKKTQPSYEELYMGPEFIIDFRYSQILTLTFVCFLYSGGMPLLYISSFAQLFITYYFDKFFLLRVCQLPKNYDEKLEKVVRTTLYTIIIFHLILTIYMYGNASIFDQNITTFTSITSTASSIVSKLQSSSDSILTKFINRAQLEHNLVLSALLILLVAVFLIDGLFLGFLRKTIFALFAKDQDESRKTISKPSNKVSPDTASNFSFFYVIKSEDIATLIRLTKVTIRATHNEELVKLLHKKLALLKREYLIKRQQEHARQVDSNINFIGFYTYDVRLSPMYKAQFAIEEQLDDEDLN